MILNFRFAQSGTALLFCAALAFLPGATPRGSAQSTFHVKRDLYSETANPRADIAAALVQARREHKRVLLDFGGNWCGDCQVLDFYYHQSPNADIIAKSYLIVYIDIGHMDKNVDIAQKYHVPIAHGVPALAILDAHGAVLYAERPKEFERPDPQAITALLNRWKA